MVRTKRKDQPIIPIDIQPHCKKTRIEKISALQIKKRKQNNDSNEEKNVPRKYARKLILIKAWYHLHQNIFNT